MAETFPASDPLASAAPGSQPERGGDTAVPAGTPRRPRGAIRRSRSTYAGETFDLDHGAVVIAAITSCTNTSNPAVMIGAGLLAKKAVERGLQRKPWVKSSLAPGSKVVTEYYEKAGLTPYLEELGFHTVGYGCTTCIGNSGPLPDEISRGVSEGDLVVCAVLSGNRNFEAQHPPGGEGELPRVTAARRRVRARRPDGRRPRDASRSGSDPTARTSSSRTSGPPRRRCRRRSRARSARRCSARPTPTCSPATSTWRELPVPDGELFAWEADSTYVRLPPYFEDMPESAAAIEDVAGARCLVSIGDSVTTDHISPAGSIKPDSPAGRYLVEHGVERKAFNSYGSRRGNHEVMVRGTFANVRLRNQLVPGVGGHVDGARALAARRRRSSRRPSATARRASRSSSSRARSTGRARRATGPRRARSSSACAP